MATQVPYTGVPEVGAQFQPTPTKSLDTPIAAFGGNVAAAVSHLGEVGNQVGNELYARAVALQELDSAAKANKAAADFDTARGLREADYLSSRGKDAKDGLIPYLGDIKSLRDKSAEGLSPYEQRLYDQETRRIQSASTAVGARHAATENKSYLIGTSDARIQAAKDGLFNAPNDPDVVAQRRTVISRESRAASALRGQGPEQADVAESNNQSDATINVATAQMGDNPWTAEETVLAAQKKGLITDAKAAPILETIRNAQLSKGSIKVAADTVSGVDPDISGEELQRKLADAAKAKRPDDPVFINRVIDAGEAIHNKERAVRLKDGQDRKTLLDGSVVGELSKDGKLPTIDDAFDDPKVKAAYDQAPANVQAQFIRRLAANAKGGYLSTPANQRQYYELMGAMTDPTATPQERERAKNMSMIDLQMPAGQVKELIGTQRKLWKEDIADIPQSRLRKVLGPMVESPGIGLTKTKDPNGYNWFYGAAREAYTEKMDQEKRPLKEEEIKEIGARLLQQVPGSGSWLGKDKRVFEQETPDKFKEQTLKLYKDSGAPIPSDDDVHHLYMRWQLRQMGEAYQTVVGGSKPKTSPTASEPKAEPLPAFGQ